MKYGANKLLPGIAVVLFVTTTICRADPVLSSGYNLALLDLGSVSLPLTTNWNTYQGLSFNGQNLLLAAWNPGQMNYPTSEELWQVPVTYSGGQISQLGAASAYATLSTDADGVPYSYVVSGGLVTSPNGTLYYTTSEGDIGRYQNGVSVVTAPVTDPSDDPNCAQTSSCHQLTAIGYLPVGGTSQLVAAFSSGKWYEVTGFTTDGNGDTLAITGAQVYTGLQATSFVYFPGPFAGYSNGGILVGNSGNQTLTLYGLAPDGSYIPNSQPTVYTVGNGQIPGYGVARDPNTGNFLFTTYDNTGNGSGSIYELQVQVPEPATAVLGVAILALLCWRRSNSQPS